MTRDLEYARRQGAAIDALYAVLTPEQQAIFNKTMLTQMQGALAPPTVPPDAEANAKPNYMAAGHTEPDWLSKPDGDTLSVFYPYRARAERMEGAAAVNCTVTPEGVAMDCKVISERPAGYGFGNATIEIASFFRFRPATVYGVPVKGQVTIPLAWKL
jgi:TonB family protein